MVPAVATTAKTRSASAPRVSRARRSPSAVRRPSVVGLDADHVGVHHPRRGPHRRVGGGRRQHGTALTLVTAIGGAPRVTGGDERARGCRPSRRPRTRRRRSAGKPARSASHRSASFSAKTAPDPSSHDPPYRADAPTTRSNSTAASVAAAGTNDRKRGWSVEMHAGASTSAKTCERRFAADAIAGDGGPGAAPQLVRGGRRVEGRGIQLQPLEGVPHDGLREDLRLAVALVHGSDPADRQGVLGVMRLTGETRYA